LPAHAITTSYRQIGAQIQSSRRGTVAAPQRRCREPNAHIAIGLDQGQTRVKADPASGTYAVPVSASPGTPAGIPAAPGDDLRPKYKTL
jgi:hypothetical protein